MYLGIRGRFSCFLGKSKILLSGSSYKEDLICRTTLVKKLTVIWSRWLLNDYRTIQPCNAQYYPSSAWKKLEPTFLIDGYLCELWQASHFLGSHFASYEVLPSATCAVRWLELIQSGTKGPPSLPYDLASLLQFWMSFKTFPFTSNSQTERNN